jgi:hypothetical protein
MDKINKEKTDALFNTFTQLCPKEKLIKFAMICILREMEGEKEWLNETNLTKLTELLCIFATTVFCATLSDADEVKILTKRRPNVKMD